MFGLLPSRTEDVRRGDAARDAGRWAEARGHYERALAAQPELDHIWVQLGHARKETDDKQGAEAAYLRAVALKPGVPDTHLQLGHLLKTMGRLDDAVKAYSEAAQLDGSLADAVKELAALGYTPDGRRAFGIVFGAPLQRRSGGAVLLETLATLDGITADEVLRMVAHQGLHVACRLHPGGSHAAETYAGRAAIGVIQPGTLRCVVQLPVAAFGDHALGAVWLGLRYGDGGVPDVALGNAPSHAGDDVSDVWMAVRADDVDLQARFRSRPAQGMRPAAPSRREARG